MPDQPKKTKAGKPTDAAQVAQYLEAFSHPLRDVLLAVRTVILNADPRLAERIKWAAPSYHCGADLVTFNPRLQDRIHLVFHHEAIVQVASPLLEGTYKDRRMMYFTDVQDVATKRAELERILQACLDLVGPPSATVADQ